MLSAGSSPRLRGAQEPVVVVDVDSGIIPASAGSTSESVDCSPEPTDHPRVCGEHAGLPATERTDRGSSPRLRGAPVCTIGGSPPARIIPASAGSTLPSPASDGWSADHPRVCGEHKAADLPAACGFGSSPRLRGAPHHIGARFVGPRIIPASAGSTSAGTVWHAG